MQVSYNCGRVHKDAPIEFEQLFEPLIPEFFSADIGRTIDIGIDQMSFSSTSSVFLLPTQR